MEPKYHVGQKVAVSNRYLTFIAPCTFITERYFARLFELTSNSTGKIWRGSNAWLYRVYDSPMTSTGPVWLHESELRPLNDDDYKEESEATYELTQSNQR